MGFAIGFQGCSLLTSLQALTPLNAPLPKPGGSNGKSIALVGKGLTFDSGGYNIKAGPGSMIEHMKVRG